MLAEIAQSAHPAIGLIVVAGGVLTFLALWKGAPAAIVCGGLTLGIGYLLRERLYDKGTNPSLEALNYGTFGLGLGVAFLITLVVFRKTGTAKQ